MFHPPNKKFFTIGDGSQKGSEAEKNAYGEQYLFSECRPVKSLEPLWKAFKKFHKIQKFEDWINTRDKCRKDNFHLGLTVGHDFVEHVHREMCLMYVQKNFDGVYHDGYTLKDLHDAFKKHQFLREQEMQMLAPRGAFKSTTNMVDCLSWMLNAPDARILILSGEKTLAEKFMMTIKGYLYQPEGADPTKFQALFPEYIVTDGDMTMKPIFSPARQIPQEGTPTLWINSIGSNLAGWHCDVLKGDDVVTDENANTDTPREQLNKKWTGAMNLLDEWGFCDNIGTRYFIDDIFGERLKLQEEVPLKFLRRACWIVKPQFHGTKLRDLTEEMVDLYFPEKLTFKSLRAKLLRNEQQFRCQQLNEPAGGDDLINFDEDVMRAAHEPLEAAPMKDEHGKALEIFVAFDTSSGSNSGDFSAGAACVFPIKPNGKADMHVVDVTYGKWKNSELAKQVVDFAVKWRPRVVLIEDWAQSELVKREITHLALQRGIYIPLLWVKRSMEFNAKKNRIQGLEILLSNGQIKFVNGWWTDELMKQFIRYTGDRVRRRHDDIPDAIAYLQKFMPDDVNTSEFEELKKQEQDRLKKEQFSAHVFNNPSAIMKIPPPPVETETRGNSIDEQFFGGMGIYR